MRLYGIIFTYGDTGILLALSIFLPEWGIMEFLCLCGICCTNLCKPIKTLVW